MVKGFTAFIIGSVFGFLVVPTLLQGMKSWMQKQTGAGIGGNLGSLLGGSAGPGAGQGFYDY
jgi:hypothetical protein